jgi:hypothetical protein
LRRIEHCLVDGANFAAEYEEISANVKSSEPHRQLYNPVRQHFHNKKAQGKFITTRLGMGIDKSILFVDAKLQCAGCEWGGGAGTGIFGINWKGTAILASTRRIDVSMSRA